MIIDVLDPPILSISQIVEYTNPLWINLSHIEWMGTVSVSTWGLSSFNWSWLISGPHTVHTILKEEVTTGSLAKTKDTSLRVSLSWRGLKVDSRVYLVKILFEGKSVDLVNNLTS
jgi:hypothetical protein